MSRIVRPNIGQGTFEGVLEAARPARNMEALNAFCRAATPEYWGINPADYAGIDDRMIAAASVDRLRSSLVNVVHDPTHKFVVDYEADNGSRVYVPLNPAEYFRVFARTTSPRKYGEVAAAATLSGKRSLEPDLEKNNARADENEVAAITQKANRMRGYVEGTLLPEQAMLARLTEAARNHWRARGKEAKMRESVGTVRHLVIPNMLGVIGRQRNWSTEQAALATRAVDYRLFFMREKNRHITNWIDILTLAFDYDQEKINAFNDRIGRFGGYLITHG